MTFLTAEWWGVLERIWNSEIPLVFTYIVLTNILGIHRDREIRACIYQWMDLYKKVVHAGLVGDAEAEGAEREGKAVREEEEKDSLEL